MQDSGASSGRSGTFASTMDWLTANYVQCDPDVHRIARRVASLFFIGMVGFVLAITIVLATGQPINAVPNFLALIGLSLCILALRAGKPVDVVANVGVAVTAAVLLGMVLATGGASIGILMATPLVPAAAALVGNKRGVSVWSAVTIIALVVAVTLNWLGFTFPVQPDPSQAATATAKFFAAIVVVGMIYGLAQLFLDDQQRTETTLKESEQLFKQAAHIVNLGHYIWDEVDDRCIFASDEYARILGVTVDDVLTRYNDSEQDLKLIHPDDRERVHATYATYEKRKSGHDIQYRITRSNGEVRHVREVEDPIFDRRGRFIQTVGILQDVTDQKRASQELEESESLLQQAVRTARLGHWRFDVSRDEYVSVSEEYARIFGYTGEEFLRRFRTLNQDLELVHPDDRERVAAAYKSPDDLHIEYRIVRADGEIRTVIELERSAAEAAGNQITYDGTLQDITELRHIQERTRELNKIRRELTDKLADARRAAQLVNLGTYVWDYKEARLVSCSEEYARIHEMSVDEALQTFDSDEAEFALIHPDDRPGIIELDAKSMANRVGYGATYRKLLPNGHIRHVREVTEVELNDQNEVTRIIGSIQDVSEQVELEELLRQSRKMEAVGQLTSGIAHDFNNVLAVVLGNLELALENTTDGSDDREILSDAMRAGQKGADLNRQLLTFSRQQVVEERVTNINEIIYGMSNLLARTLGEEIEIETQYSEDDCFCKLDAALLESAILNLAINARDAMIGGGKLKIQTSLFQPDKTTRYVDTHKTMIRMSVSDNGSGMTADVKERALEPFFTTKEVGAGSGLGLSMVYGFVAQTAGWIEIDSEPGQGTIVHVLLPFADERDDTLAVAGASRMPLSIHGEVVLVVEDQTSVRDVVVRQLCNLGYQVLEAENGNAAVRILEDSDPIDLVLSDMVMPGGLSGEVLVKKAMKMRPGIKAILMSGNPVRSQGSYSDIQAPILRKPFGQTDLARAVRDRLDGG